MLQSIREHSQGWLAWLIVGLISIPFALWGINSYLNGASKVTVASVNGVDIELTQFQNAMDNYKARLQQVFGKSFDINSMDQNRLKQDVINGLVEQQVLSQYAKKNGMRINDKQLSSMIRSIDVFKDKNGNFSNAIYERQILQSRASPAVFEQQLRGDMIQDQLKRSISDSAFVTKEEKNHFAQLQAQKRSIAYTVIPADRFKKDIQINDDAISTFYEKNKENYKTEESVKIKYIDLSVEELAKQVKVTDDALREYYHSNLDKYTLEERRIAQYILIVLKPDASAKEVKKAKESAQKLYKLVKSGVDFDLIPQEHAELLGPMDEINTTGAISKGVMDPEFDEALFSMKEGEISEPVRSKRGLQIVKLVEIQKAKTSSFDEVKDSVESEYRHEHAEAKYFETADELQNLVYENPDSLEVAAETLGLEIKQMGSFTRKGGKDELTKNPKVLKAAFSEEVINGANSEPLELSDTRLVVIHSFDHQPAVIKGLDIVHDEVKKALLNAKAKAKAEQLGKTILTRLKEGVDRDQVAKEESIEWTVKESVGRDDPEVKHSILRSVFKLGRPVDNKPVYKGFSDGISDYIVAGVTAVNDADLEWSGTDDFIKKSIDKLQVQRSSEEWQDFAASLKQRADIKINSGAF